MTMHPCTERTATDARCRMLRPALRYASRGWPVFPCRANKQPATPHGFKDASADREKILAWWIANPAAMIGTPTGAASGIVVVDLDTDSAEGIDGASAFAALAKSVGEPIRTRTHRTPRGGRHLLFAHPGEHVKTTACALARGVDTRGDGAYIIMPPSKSHAGEYTVEVDEDPAQLPAWVRRLFQEVGIMGMGSSVTEPTETTEAICSAGSALSAISVTYSPDEVISLTTPKRPGERNVRLLDLARGLKFNAALADRPLREMKPLVRRAHAAALPFIGTKDFDSTWTDFVHAWGQARFPLGVDVLTEAWKRAQTDPAPAVADDYDSAPVRRLVGLCDALARFSPDSRFFLSTHSASRLIGASAMQVCRWLRMLVADSVLKVEHVGNEHRATRYQWTAPKDGGAR